MFDRLRETLRNLKSAISDHTISDVELDKILSDFEMGLLQSDVAQSVIAKITAAVKNELVGTKVSHSADRKILVREGLRRAIEEAIPQSSQPDFFKMIDGKKAKKEPFVVTLLGINGTGKTTTIAKLANLLKKKGYTLVMACADTHRAGAIEQLSEHAQRLNIKVVAQRYGSDPAAVARDAVMYAKNHAIDVVLIDTAGRMQTSRNLMDEMTKIVRVVQPDLKIFVADALIGNDAVSQAEEFFAATKFDAAILTKTDTDVKGGAALSISSLTARPILYLGTGQGYDDLVPFSREEFLRSVLENE